ETVLALHFKTRSDYSFLQKFLENNSEVQLCALALTNNQVLVKLWPQILSILIRDSIHNDVTHVALSQNGTIAQFLDDFSDPSNFENTTVELQMPHFPNYLIHIATGHAYVHL